MNTLAKQNLSMAVKAIDLVRESDDPETIEKHLNGAIHSIQAALRQERVTRRAVAILDALSPGASGAGDEN